jgi:DnaJ-class molecular chaperone
MGVDNGVNLRMNGKGHTSKYGPPGDLMIKVKVKDHPYFKRDKFDIHTDQFITVSEAILGGEAVAKTLGGEIKLTINPGTQHNDRKRLVG